MEIIAAKNKNFSVKPYSHLYQTTFWLLAVPLMLPAFLAFNLFLTKRQGVIPLLFPPVLKTLFFQIMVEVAVLCFVYLAVRERQWRPFFTTAHFWLIGASLVLLISTLFSPDVWASFLGNEVRADSVFFLLHVLVYILLLSWVISEKRKFEILLNIARASGAVMLLFVVLILVLSRFVNVELGQWRALTGLIFGNTAFFGHYLLLLFALNTYFVLRQPGFWNIALATIYFLFAVVSMSSTAVILMTGLVIWLIWRLRRAWWPWIMLGLTLLVSSLTFANPKILEPLLGVMDSFKVRFAVWLDALGIVWRTRPWLGFGWGNDELIWNFTTRESFYTTGGPYSPIIFDKMHNILAEILASFGLFGALFLILGLGALAYRLYVRPRIQEDNARYFLQAFFFAQFIFLLFNFDTVMSYTLVSVGFVGFILLYRGKEYMFEIPKKFLILVVVVSILGLSAMLFYFNLKPFYAYSLSWRAEYLLERRALLKTQFTKQKIMALLNRAFAVEQPYTLLFSDTKRGFHNLPHIFDFSAAEKEELLLLFTQEYEKMQTEHPQNPLYLFNLASLRSTFVGMGIGANQELLRQAVELAPRRGLFRFWLAVEYLHSNEPQRAKLILEELQQEGFYPGTVDMYLAMIDFLTGDLEQGKKQVLKILSAYTPASEEWDRLTLAYLRQGKPEDLRQWYSRLVHIVEHDQKQQESLFKQITRNLPSS